MKKKHILGFTLIELLVVIGILSILLAITLIAINPSRQFSQSNDTKRRSDINAILNAVNQYMADNKGQLPTGIDTTMRTITNNTGVSNRVDLCEYLVPSYIAALPVDPTTDNGTPVSDCGTTYNTTYRIVKGAADNRLTVSASGEIDTSITVTR